MFKIIDKFKNEIVLFAERWKHVVSEHPEVKGYLEEIKNTLKDPDLVKRSKRDKKIWLFYKFYKQIFGGKYLLVVADKRSEFRNYLLHNGQG